MIMFSAQIYAQIEAGYSRYEVKDNALYLIINLNVTIQRPALQAISTPQPTSQATSQIPGFIVIPRFFYDVQLHRCDNAGISCDPVSQGSVYRGEVNWLEIPCYTIPCSREAKLPIILDKELIDKLVSIVEGGERPAFQVILSNDVPHAIASMSLSNVISNVNVDVMTPLNLNLPVPVKGNLSPAFQYIVLSSDDVKRILNSVKYFERVKVEVEVKLPETTEGLPKPLVDAVKALRAAFNDINNLDFASAVIKCRGALELITKYEKRGGQDVKVLRDEIKNAILSKYEGTAKEVYSDILDIIEGVIRDTYRMMNKFIHPREKGSSSSDKDKEESYEIVFNPRMVDAVYIFRQTVDIINYLVELSRA
jgi:hypothetical protein